MRSLFVVICRETVFQWMQHVISSNVVIGRHENCDLRLPGEFVSRKHAIILTAGHNHLIRDLKSRNGTLLNGQPVVCDQILSSSDEVKIGPYCLKVYFEEREAQLTIENLNHSTLDARPSNALDDAPSDATRLTPAQFRVLELFLQGYVEKEVAKMLGITVATVHDHAKAIYKTLSVTSRGQLLARFLKQTRS